MIDLPKIGDANWGPNLLAYLNEVDRRLKILVLCVTLQSVAIIFLGLAALGWTLFG